MNKLIRRAFSIMGSQERNINIERYLYHIKYIIPLRDDKIGNVKQFEIVDNEIIITVENPEIKQYIKKDTNVPELPYHYGS